jgi:hypothetical protein
VRLVVLVDAEVLLGEVADVPHRGLDRVLAAEELLEGARFRGAFDDDEVNGHEWLETGSRRVFIPALVRRALCGRAQ